MRHSTSRLASFAILWTTSLLLLPTADVLAQGTQADYARAAELQGQTRNKVTNSKVEPHWFGPTMSRFWYRRDAQPHGHEFIVIDAEQGTRQTAFDHQGVAKALSARLNKPVEALRLPLNAIEFNSDATAIQFSVDKQGFRYDLESGELTANESSKGESTPAQPRPRGNGRGRFRGEQSPDGLKTVFVRDHNLMVRLKGSTDEIQLSRDGTADEGYDASVYWSPDSTRLVALRTQWAAEHKVYLIESSPKDQEQPKLHSFDYLKPGDRIAHPHVCLFEVPATADAAASALHPRNAPHTIHEELFPSPWSIDSIRWSADSRRFKFAYNQRGHQVLRIIAVDAATRVPSLVINEESPTFIDYAGKHFIEYVDNAQEIIWMSERSGWNHLYLYDASNGHVKNPITQGHWVVRGVDEVDHQRRQVTFRASGIHPEQDPYYVHFGRVNFDGTGLTWLTAGDGTHTVEYSPGNRYLLDTCSRVDLPPVQTLRNTSDGSRICDVEQADWSALLKTGWKAPVRFQAKGRDGATDIHGVIWHPTNFDPQKKYPVIEYIYAGPHSAFTPKSFSAYYGTQAMAELGFIVVQMDGMGTSHRSKAFHDVCWKNLGDSGFPDRMAWIKAAAADRPYMDLTRVGIYGGSAGGQSSTRAMLAHGDFYKAAVSDCGCHDNRMDKIWWNELWMGYPIGDHYAQQSNVTNAHKLQGKLMLVVGELDRNVDPASTMQVANALIKADKDFDLLIIPGAGHGAAESPYGKRRRMDFFVRHLLGVEPRSTQ